MGITYQLLQGMSVKLASSDPLVVYEAGLELAQTEAGIDEGVWIEELNLAYGGSATSEFFFENRCPNCVEGDWALVDSDGREVKVEGSNISY